MTEGPYRKPSQPDPQEPPPGAKPWELQTWTSRRMCPTCSIPMFGARQDGFRIDACGTCGGAWLAHEEAQRMITARSSTPAKLSEQAAAAAPNRQLVPEGRPCPDCQTSLERHHIYPCDVDSCKVHGTWFDAHELRACAEASIRRLQQSDSREADAGIYQLAAEADNRAAGVAVAGGVLGVLGVLGGRVRVRF
jgi:Zn-finger nucleic acid-binding protein